jgi:hypothetical protein
MREIGGKAFTILARNERRRKTVKRQQRKVEDW